jgi:hypothetical protein
MNLEFDLKPSLPPLPKAQKPPVMPKVPAPLPRTALFPPLPKLSKARFTHFAFARIHLYPLPPPRKASPMPPACFKTLLPSFPSPGELKKWLASFCTDSHIDKIWQCIFCGQYHHESYPLDLTGQTSGKSLRRDYWIICKGKNEISDNPEKQKRINDVNKIVRRIYGCKHD